jgi:uncharacterized protein with FMN-binding domain
MRRIAAWAMSTLTVLVLLFSYSTSRSSQVVASTAETRSASSSGSSVTSEQTEQEDEDADDDSSSDPTAESGSASGSTSGSASGSQSSSASQTYAGDEVMTRFGVVQVQITVENGKITTSEVLQVPWSDRRDQMINSRAVPVYNEEAVAAQSADIDVVSGATVTWEGYTESLQSAIDQANL